MLRAINLASRSVVGFRFHPTDEELVDHYMKLKMQGYDDRVSDIIAEVDICKFEPRELPGLSPINSENETSWYFFCPPDYKYTNSKRFNRTTKEGFWKVTGKDRVIKGKRNKKVIGIKKTLVFHENNKPKSIKPSWVIHEYHSKVTYPNQREIVLCRLKYKQDDTTDISSSDEGESSQRHIVFDFDDEAEDTIMGEGDDQRLAEIMSQLQSLINPNQNPIEITGQLLRRVFNASEPERSRVLVNSFPPDQDAYSYEGASMPTIILDSSPSESSSSRVRVRSRSPRFADYGANHMLEPQGGLPPDTRTSKSQYQPKSQTVVEFQGDYGDSSSRVTSTSMAQEQGVSSKSPHQPKFKNYEKPEYPGTMELQMYSAPKAASKNKAKEAEGQGDTDDLKGSMVVYSNKSSKMAESSSKSSSKTKSPRAFDRQGKYCFIVLESSPLRHIQEPPSVYIFNMVIGIIVFVSAVWELMALH